MNATPRPGTSDRTSEETGARTPQAAALITEARSQIEELDRRIIALVQQRMAVSTTIQRARIDSGGRRVSLSREMEIIAGYTAELGKPGTALAMTLLELCRGQA
jgi:chorismate mutase